MLAQPSNDKVVIPSLLLTAKVDQYVFLPEQSVASTSSVVEFAVCFTYQFDRKVYIFRGSTVKESNDPPKFFLTIILPEG